MNASNSDSSTTHSGISGGTITITDEAKHQALTGESAKETIANLNREVETGVDTTNSLSPIFDKEEIERGFEITKAFSNETSTFLANRAKESTEALDKELEKPLDQQDPTKIAQYQETLADNATWGMGGTGRRVVTALNLAASGNVTGGGTEFMQAATVNYFQSLVVEQVKIIADELDSETARAALQGLVACGGAAAQGASCGSAAAGASASVVLNNLMDSVTGEKGEELDSDEKIARENLISTIVMGITAEAGGDVPMAIAAAQIEMENNTLLTTGMKVAGWTLTVGGIPLDEIGVGEVMQVGGVWLRRTANGMEVLEDVGVIGNGGAAEAGEAGETVSSGEQAEPSGGAPIPPDDDNNNEKKEAKFADKEKLDDHFERHGDDFGAKNSKEYEQQASDFLNDDLKDGVLEKTRSNGDRVRYNSETEEFGVASKDGTTRTYYKPDPARNGMSNLEYFNAQ